MGHHGIQTPGGSQVSDLLGKEMVATPTISRLRRRLELPHAIKPERAGLGERPRPSLMPVAVDGVMLVAASVATRLLSLAAGKTLSPVVWDSLFFVLVIVGFGLRGLY